MRPSIDCKKLLTVCVLCLSACWAALPSAEAKAETKAEIKTMVSELLRDSQDDRAQSLLPSVASAQSNYGVDSPIVFERLVDLIKFYTDGNDAKSLITLGPELAVIFAKLPKDNQQYFAPQLLTLALQLSNAKQSMAASAIYVPVIESGQITQWQNPIEVGPLVMAIGRSQQEQGRNIEAEHIFSAGKRLLVARNLFSDDYLRQVAQFHCQAKMFDKALEEYEQLASTPAAKPADLQTLLQIYAELGDQKKLDALVERIKKLARKPQTNETADEVARLISAYAKIGTSSKIMDLGDAFTEGMHIGSSSKSIDLCKSFIQGMQAGKLHAQSQWNGISPIVNGLPSEDATELYKFWTDSTKELSGSSSADWLESLVFRYQFCQRFPNEAAAIRKEVVEAKVTPGDTRQRLAYLRLLSVINDINDKGLQEISIDQFLDGVPMDRAGLDLYLEASRYYSNKQLYEKSNKCTKDLLEAISQMLPAEDSWLRPYIFKLVPDGGTNRSDPTRYLSQFVFMIKMHRQMHDYRLLADEVSSQLSMRHQVKDEESLIEDQLTMLGASGDSNPAIVESVMRRYVYMLEGLKHIQYQEGAQPNLELVKQAHCFFLKGALQESWKKPTRGKGKTVVAFSLDTHGIKDAHITHSCGQKSNDQSALRAFSVIEDPALPASELHFEATLDQETGILSIS